MARKILILAKPGSGKTTSMRNLDPKTTVVLQAINKELPFKGSNKSYNAAAKNKFVYESSTNLAAILKSLSASAKHKGVKTIVVDDYSAILVKELVRYRNDGGFQKYENIAFDAVELFSAIDELRDDLTVVLMAHTDTDANGNIKFKSVGKFIEEKLEPEGYFTVLLTMDGDNNFITNNSQISKSPMDMFETVIPNDLVPLIETMHEYYA